MKLLTPNVFSPFSRVSAAMSLREAKIPDELDMSPRNHNRKLAKSNRHNFAAELGFTLNKLLIPEQIHSDIVHIGGEDYTPHPGDAIISNQPGWMLGVYVADCLPILLYDPNTDSYAAIHSGWRGSAQNIVANTIGKMTQNFGVFPSNLYAWIGPGAATDSYEVGYEVAEQFNPKYSRQSEGDRWLFDNKNVVNDQLLATGVLAEHIEMSSLDTITNPELHSARRDGDKSGRMLAAIGLMNL